MCKKEMLYCCPCCGKPLELMIFKMINGEVIEGEFLSPHKDKFSIINCVPDFTWPKELPESDLKARSAYEKLADDYEKFADIPFLTYKVSESEVRERMINQLDIKKDSIVLEIGCGSGRGSEMIAKRLGKNGKLYLQELSPAFLNKAIKRMVGYDIDIEFSIANGCYLPFPDNAFNSAHHFGGLNTFSEIARCLKELARVVKPGGKVVVGDESMAPWLWQTEFGKIMMNSNPLLKCKVPFDKIPVEARDVRVEWIMKGAFYVIEFHVGEGPQEADYHIKIPSERGGTHWIRYHGNLEGVSDETKKLAYKARAKSGKSMHEWLDEVVKNAAKNQLDE